MSRVQVHRPTLGSAQKLGASRLWVAKLYYLFFFAAIGGLAPYFNIYLQQRGLSGTEIGVIGSIPPLIALLANPFWGGLADRTRKYQLVLAICVLGAGLLTIPFIWLRGFWPLLALISIMIFFRAPVTALVDSAVMNIVTRTGASYGRQRMFGSLGFVLASYGLGQLLDPGNLDAIFWLHCLLLAIGCTILSFLLPMEHAVEAGQSSLMAGLRILGRQRSYMAFLAMNICLGFGAACFVNFIGLRMLSLGATDAQVGTAFAANALTEMPIFFIGARLLSRFSLNTLIVAGAVGLASAYTVSGFAPSPTLIFVVMLACGFSYSTFWTAVVVYANETAPPGLRATGQALVGASQGGLGWAMGAITAGVLWDSLGGTAVLVTAGIAVFVGAIVFQVGQRSPVAHAQR